MNRVYKVIWSKAKHCYVVTSEIARSVTKSASSARSAGRKGAAVLAMAALLFTAGGVLGEAATPNVTDVSGSIEAQNLIIVTKDDGTSKNFAINNVKKAEEADYALKATGDGNGEVIHNTYARKADVEKDYVKKTDAQVGADGTYVKTDKTVGQNLSALDANLSALDEQVTKNTMAVAGVMEAGEKVGEKLTDLDKQVKVNADAVAAEETARKQADQNNLKIEGDDGVISKVTGNDGTKSSAVNKLVLNKDDKNQITLSGDGIKVGLNSGVMDKDGFYAGGDDYEHAGAALKWDGSVKGAGGKFTVEADGKVTAASGKIGNVDITSAGAVSGVTDLTVTGTFDSKTLSSTVVPDINYTTINGGKMESMNQKKDIKTGETQESASTFDENGSNAWAKDDDSIGKSSMTADKISQSLSDTGDYPKSAASRVLSQNKDKYEIADVVSGNNGTNESIINQTETGIKSTATDGKNNASTNLSNNGFNTYASDGGKNKTYTKQTAESLTSQIGDDGKVMSVMNAEGISNNADGGTITNSAKDLVNTATGNMTNTVGKDLTTTVTGDSSLTAENITNEAKNKITNKALDVETDAASSIVSKVSNDYGSNTSTQLSHQTMEEMKAEGKTASYLRGAAEEKSQLIDGDVKTTIDTIAGQTNTNITEGKNVSNSLQKADQIASSVTDGTNTTGVNQDAGSLASSITDGTKVNNTNNTVDKSEQLIKVDDTHFYAETRTADSAVEALKSDGNTIISAKDAVTGTVSSAVTDGATITGISQNAKDISLSAAGGTITNTAKKLVNTATGDMENKVGGNLTNNVTGNMTSNVTGDSSLSANNITNTATVKLSNSAADIENTATNSITDKVGKNTSWKMTDGTVVESVKDASGKTNQTTTTAADTYQFVKDGDNTLAKRTSSTNDNLNITDGTNTYTKITTATSNKQTVTGGTETASTNLTKEASNTLIENGTQSVLDHMAADTSYTVMNENGNGSRRQQTASEILDRVTDGTDTSEVKQTASEVAASAKNISNTATDKITSQIGNGSAVKSEMTADGITNITGKNKVISDNDGTTFENEDAKTPFVKGGEVNTKITGNKVETGKVLTDDLTVRGTSEFVGRADFRNDVYVDENLTVAKETRTDTLYVDHDGYVGGNLIVDGNIETHDAVLSADSRQVVTGRQLYQTNERVDRLDNRIKKVGANAAALAALRPGDFNPDDKFSIAAGFGSYRNANAAALGLFYRPNENVLLSLGTSFGDGENMVNAGVSVKFGRGKSMAERRKEMADEVSSMRDEMRSQDERIAELEEMLKKQSELIEKLSKES